MQNLVCRDCSTQIHASLTQAPSRTSILTTQNLPYTKLKQGERPEAEENINVKWKRRQVYCSGKRCRSSIWRCPERVSVREEGKFIPSRGAEDRKGEGTRRQWRVETSLRMCRCVQNTVDTSKSNRCFTPSQPVQLYQGDCGHEVTHT